MMAAVRGEAMSEVRVSGDALKSLILSGLILK